MAKALAANPCRRIPIFNGMSKCARCALFCAKGHKDGQVIAEQKVENHLRGPAYRRQTHSRPGFHRRRYSEDICIITVAVTDSDGAHRAGGRQPHWSLSLSWPRQNHIGVGNGDPSCHRGGRERRGANPAHTVCFEGLAHQTRRQLSQPSRGRGKSRCQWLARGKRGQPGRPIESG